MTKSHRVVHNMTPVLSQAYLKYVLEVVNSRARGTVGVSTNNVGI